MNDTPDASVPLERPPGALRALGVGLRLAHANFLRLYPLALLVGGALELLAIATGTATSASLFGKLPDDFAAIFGRSAGVRRFALALLHTFGIFAPPLITTAILAHAIRARLRAEPIRPLASLWNGMRSLHVAIATAVAFSIVPVAANWFPTLAADPAAIIRTYAWVLPLSLPLAAAVVARWLLAVPCAALEKRGVISAWRRSERLVAGRQLPTLGLVLLGIASWIALFDLVTWSMLLLSGHRDWIAAAFRHALDENRAREFGRVAILAWFHLGVAAVTTVYFDRVRIAKDGPDADELRQVFK